MCLYVLHRRGLLYHTDFKAPLKEAFLHYRRRETVKKKETETESHQSEEIVRDKNIVNARTGLRKRQEHKVQARGK